MPITLYLYSKCSTCQAAANFLTKQNTLFTKKEITLTPPSIQELQQMLGYLGNDLKKLFNSSGLLYKELKLKEKLPSLTLDEALLLLSQNGMLVKRPFLIGDAFGLVGFNEKKWSEMKM